VSWILNDEVLAVLAAVIIVSSVFAGVQVFNAGRVVEPFSELGLLGPDGKIGGYPKRVVAGSSFPLNIYVGNHEGRTAYYKVLVKLGGDSPVVNETNPLSAEPIMEVRAVLSHNTSQMIPLDITLYEPATRLRLVFEMWVFNETAGGFSYHGRWNQLWLNVTEPPLGAPTPTRREKISPEMESRLVEGYLSVRRAEDAGGNVSEMVGLLNQALRLAESRNEAGAEDIVSRVTAMEPEVSRLGLEASRMRLYTDAGALAAASIVGVGSFMFLRRRVWVYWARLHSGCRIVWSGGNSKLSGLEKAIRDRVKSSGETSVGSLVFSPGLSYGAHEVARALYRLARNGAIRLVDSNPPESFASYILSKYNLGFAVATLLVAACLFSVYCSGLMPVLAASRIVFGSLFTLFLPGYSLIEALYPREDELSPLERLALSIGLSLALVPLVGLVLNYTPWGIRLDPTMAALSTLTLALLLVSAYRKFGVLRLKAAAGG
jgi:uncharacterized membrane protein